MITSSEAGITNITFEGDCQHVVQEVNSDSLCDSMLRTIVYDIRCLLAFNPFLKVKYVPREANGVAHNLAKLALSLSGQNIWVEECPLSVMPLVVKDQSCICI